MKETEYARAMKDQAWVKNSDIAAQACAPGVERTVSYTHLTLPTTERV